MDRFKNRAHAVMELLESEEVYVKHLMFLVEHYLLPVDRGKIISQNSIDIIFGNIQQVLQINQSFLNNLRNHFSDTERQYVQVHKPFHTFLPFFKVYTEFVHGHAMSSVEVDKVIAKVPKFKSLLKSNESNPIFDGLDFHDLLITPVQRIPRYSLLLKTILKHTPNFMDDYQRIPLLIEELETLGALINQSAQDSEEWMRMCRIQNKFVHGRKFNLAIFGRKLVLSQVLMKRSVSSTARLYTFFLFSDLLLYAHKSLQGYVIHHSFAIDTIDVQKLPEMVGEPLHRIQVLNTKKSFILCCPDQHSQRKWLNAINNTVDEFLHTNASFNSHAKRDQHFRKLKTLKATHDSSRVCTACSMSFSPFRRRRHCDECGSLVCGKCCESKTKLCIKCFKDDHSVVSEVIPDSVKMNGMDPFELLSQRSYSFSSFNHLQ